MLNSVLQGWGQFGPKGFAFGYLKRGPVKKDFQNFLTCCHGN